MKVIEMSKHRERADPRETAKSLESLIEENKIRGVDPQETLVWCISFCFSRLIHEQKDINVSLNTLDQIVSGYSEEDVYSALYQNLLEFE